MVKLLQACLPFGFNWQNYFERKTQAYLSDKCC